MLTGPCGSFLQVVVDVGVALAPGATDDGVHPVGVSGSEEMSVGSQHLVGELLERRDVVHDPEAATVGGDDQIVEVLLHHHVVDRGVGQVVLKGQPVPAVVERNVDGVLGAQVEQPLPHRVFVDPVHVAEDADRGRSEPMDVQLWP